MNILHWQSVTPRELWKTWIYKNWSSYWTLIICIVYLALSILYRNLKRILPRTVFDWPMTAVFRPYSPTKNMSCYEEFGWFPSGYRYVSCVSIDVPWRKDNVLRARVSSESRQASPFNCVLRDSSLTSKISRFFIYFFLFIFHCTQGVARLETSRAQISPSGLIEIVGYTKVVYFLYVI